MPTEPFDSLLSRSRAVLLERGAIKGADLMKLKVPSPIRGEVLDSLAGQGFETFAGGVRIPLDRQLADLLKEHGLVSVKELPKRLKGTGAAEAKTLAQAFAQQGRAVWVLRGKSDVLCAPGVPVLAPAERKALGLAVKSLSNQIAAAERSRAVSKTLLREDVDEALADVVPLRPEASVLPVSLLREIQRLIRPDLGLCYVPELVQRLAMDYPVARIHEALLQAARERRIELRPESGLGRLSAVELALCPAGLHETRLSWTRLLDAGS